MKRRFRVLLSVLLLALGGCPVYPPSVPVALPAPGDFPHGLLTQALEGRVDGDGRVDYAALGADRALLEEYRGYLALASPHSHPELFPTRDDQLAYWINAYNALAITGVVDRPGLERVIDQRIRFFWWTRYPLGGDAVSLYELENTTIRGEFGEPRVHFALNCQSRGCPVLPREAFPADRLDAFLEASTRAFIGDPDNVRVREDGVVELSEIFFWYAEDFEKDGGVRAFLREYRPDVPVDAPLERIPYDWGLIAQPGRGP